MRKVSREMPAEWALEVMRKAPYITVSFIRKDGSAYGLPLSLASAEDGRVWYFHCALEGEKLEAIEAHPEVAHSHFNTARQWHSAALSRSSTRGRKSGPSASSAGGSCPGTWTHLTNPYAAACIARQWCASPSPRRRPASASNTTGKGRR